MKYLKTINTKSKKVIIKIEARRFKEDPEKQVLPGIIYCSGSEGNEIYAKWVGFGWWDWAITFSFAVRNKIL
jgi:hypothetical protein